MNIIDYVLKGKTRSLAFAFGMLSSSAEFLITGTSTDVNCKTFPIVNTILGGVIILHSYRAFNKAAEDTNHHFTKDSEITHPDVQNKSNFEVK